MIDKFDFKFESRYIGLWYQPNNPNKKYSGTLFLEKQNIYIELYFQGEDIANSEQLDSLYGSAYSYEKQNNKEYSVNVALQGLTCLKCNRFGIGLKHYKYEVKKMFIFDDGLSFDNINSICFKSAILNQWAANIMKTAFKNNENEINNNKSNIISYNPPQPYTLLKSEDVSICISFCFFRTIGGISQGITQQAYLRFCLNKHLSFTESLEMMQKYCYLLFLLTNRTFTPENITCYNKGKFVYKVNEKYAYRYIDIPPAFSPQTELTDFTNEEILSIFTKWNLLYSKHSDAINTFYETLLNWYSPPASQLRNYISFIDSVTKEFKSEKCEIDFNSKRAKRVKEILMKVDKYLNKQEINELTNWLFRSTGKELKPRFHKLLEYLDGLLPDEINPDFATKVVNTRNNITHPNTNNENSFNKSQYEEVAYKLTKVIRAFMLKKIGVKEDIIKDIIKF
ncbi:HEPN domain-containing protein [Segatella copri]|uniref:ApeA N-terminal domain 1-containing protein n=1 Tax=Segatella copri TaxID=165179 RepID=UPI003F9D3002